ncbi:hypothetical protein LguiA_032042 [Lonicera macranthoides]
MDDLSLQKIQISGPTLASLLHRTSSSLGDVDGLLFGHITPLTTSPLTDDDPTTSDSPTLIATVTSFFTSISTTTFYSPSGHLNLPILLSLLPSHQTLIGWFSARRKTSLRPSMRETSFTASLSSQIQLSFPIANSLRSYTLSPSIFLLLTTPFTDQLIHTHEYKAYQYRFSSDLFESKTLDVVNIGPAFRGHYGNFTPTNSNFPLLPCQIRDSRNSSSTSMVEDRTETENLKNQKEIDLCAKGFEIRRLKGLIGSNAVNYTSELEDLYSKMLAKLDGLARLVEKSSARVLEQENHNLKLRYKFAGLE